VPSVPVRTTGAGIDAYLRSGRAIGAKRHHLSTAAISYAVYDALKARHSSPLLPFEQLADANDTSNRVPVAQSGYRELFVQVVILVVFGALKGQLQG
jgi:hypothetical protein